MYKENFTITDKETGKIYWISRAMAVCGIIVSVRPDGKLVFLIEKRGPDCPDFVGYYCNPCGYLGWGETRRQAVLREIYEETGLDFRGHEDSDGLIEWMTVDNPEENARQNVTTRFIINADYDDIKDHEFSLNSEDRGGEKGECSEIKVISEDEIDNYQWAWNHGELLKQFVREYRLALAEED